MAPSDGFHAVMFNFRSVPRQFHGRRIVVFDWHIILERTVLSYSFKKHYAVNNNIMNFPIILCFVDTSTCDVSLELPTRFIYMVPHLFDQNANIFICLF